MWEPAVWRPSWLQPGLPQTDMIICNADNVDVIHELINGEEKGTLFLAHPNRDFDLMDYINTKYETGK